MKQDITDLCFKDKSKGAILENKNSTICSAELCRFVILL